MHERLLLLLAATLCFSALAFGAAAIFIPEFATNGAVIVGTILTTLTTALSTLFGFTFAKRNINGNGAKETEAPPADQGNEGKAR